MPLYLPELGALISYSNLVLGDPPSIPWYQSDKFFLVPLLFLFGAGVLLGFILKPKAKKLIGEDVDDEEIEEGYDAFPEERTAQLREEISADFERSRAELQGEMDAAQSLIQQQKSEIEQRDEKLAKTEAEIESRERRVDEMVSLTKQGEDGRGNPSVVSHAKASVIQLSELIKSERLFIGSGISRLEQIEDRITDQKSQVWSGIEEVTNLRSAVDEKGSRRDRELAKQLATIEEQMRVHHQNASGCVQHATAFKAQLQSRQSQLGNTVEPVRCAEERMAALDDSESKNVISEIEIVIEELTLSKELIGGQKVGMQQGIAELDGRVDWLLNDSSKGFFATLETLKEVKLPRSKDLRGELTTTERKLSEIRSLLTRMADPDASSPIASAPDIRRPIEPAFSDTISALQAATLAPSISNVSVATPAEPLDVSEFEIEIEALKSQLESEKKSAEDLRGSLSETQSLVQELEKKAHAAEVPAERDSTGPKLMRRLLRLGPGRSEIASNALAETSHDKGLTGPQISIHELKSVAASVDTGPVSRVEDTQELEELRQSLTERDSKISELESEIRQLTAPIPLPSELPDFEKNPEVQSIPNVTILPLEPGRFGEGKSDESEELNDSPEVIPLIAGSSGSDGKKQEVTTVVFRGDDPNTWNSPYHDSEGNIAIPLEELCDSIEFLRLKRLDTGETVEIPITREALISGSSRDGSRGWSGKAEHYFGSMHLGIFDETLPHSVETKFGAGGWGFGHRYEIGSGQAFSWEGKEIDPVRFEITVGKVGTESFTKQPGDTQPLQQSGDSVAAKQGAFDDPTLLDHDGISNQQGAFAEPTGSVREADPAKFPEEGVVIFRSNDPSLWNRTVYRGTNQRALALDDLDGADQIKWLKLKQCDSGESVLVPITEKQLTANGDGGTFGFNGANELFYGAHHLGVFDSNAKLDIETRFTFGGWGFGHRNSIAADESQACGWAGEEIPSNTVFEMTVFSELPDAGPKDVVLGGAEN